MTIKFPSWIRHYQERFRNARANASNESCHQVNLQGTPQNRKYSVVVEVGTTKLLSANYESLDYDICENKLMQDEERRKGKTFLTKKNLVRWVVFFFIGVVTAFVGVFIDISIHVLSSYKFKLVSYYMASSTNEETLYIPYLVWAGINVAAVFVGAVLVTYVEPVAGGSGIPQVKCYLNGVKIKNIVRVRTLFVKVIGVISSVVSGLAAGKEGPMIHAGAFVAAALSQGKAASLKTDFGILKYFREDHEKRDFVSGGAAAGVAAAFGSPIGGVLFSLEEGASFWNQCLTWRIFFASSLAAFTLNVILTSFYTSSPGMLSHDGLLNFGHFNNLDYEIVELPLFIIMGAIGGCLGSFYTFLSYKLTVFRMRYVRNNILKVLEACIVAMMSATVGMIGIYLTKDCKPLGQDPNPYPVQIHCADGQYNTMAAIWLQVPEDSVRSLFHDPKASHQVGTLIMFLFTYLGLSIWTYGLSVSAGIFIPSLLTGAAWGRLIGIALEFVFPNRAWVDPGKYALVGAAAHLGGVVRMTISLTVILVEATGNINFGLPLMITLITAKWVGDFFTEGFYDLHIQLAGVPLLGWDPPPLSSHIKACSFMSCVCVKVFPPIVKVGDVVKTLTNYTYNGFPIVKSCEKRITVDGLTTYGKLGGLILRSQLILLIKNKIYTHLPENVMNCNINTFRLAYPQYHQIEDLEISDEEKTFSIDLTPFMNPSPYAVTYMTSLPRVFRLFRALGLRHLVVVTDINEVVGMVTRKDLAKYRWEDHGKSGIQILTISNAI